jgi:ribosome-binding protein aMBF1 (putative translation factor)
MSITTTNFVNDSNNEFINIVKVKQIDGTDLPHLEVCGRKLSYNASAKNSRDVVQNLVNEYGQRALQAEQQQGIDWKALSHAVRVGNQAIELLETHYVTFPLPNREHILDIKLGRLQYQAVAEEIEELLVKVEDAAAKSTLPDSPDLRWIEDFVYDSYLSEIVKE